MTQRDCKFAQRSLGILALAACTTPNPNYRKPSSDGGADGKCIAGAALRCDGTNRLIRCNAEGSAEVSEPCVLECNATELRCTDVDPSNGLAKFLDIASAQQDLNLGDRATFNTDTGEVKVGDTSIAVHSETFAQTNGPVVRVFSVKSLIAQGVVATGKNAFALVSNGDINLNGIFTASASGPLPGAGAYNDGNGHCRGQDPPASGLPRGEGGQGGGGFGTSGGSGGLAHYGIATAIGGSGGTIAGNAAMVPLRGGCDGGGRVAKYPAGAGGGAIQLVSRTIIAVSGTVAANGGKGAGGGAGGGILLEAPIVEVSGSVVANGGSGFTCTGGEDGRLDAVPATGGGDCGPFPDFEVSYGGGGNGAAGLIDATTGRARLVSGQSSITPRGGPGGGGVGRVRVNTASGGILGGGVFSPPPSTGTVRSR